MKEYTSLTKKEEELLTLKEKPIVLVKKQTKSNLSNSVAPNINRLGCFIAYTPLHHLLFRFLHKPIVATSANLKDEPIIRYKDEVLENILKEENLSWNQVAAIGDDLNDYKMLKKAGLSFTPANGSKYIEDVVNIRCEAYGGSGAVKEMIEYIIKEDGIEEEYVNSWL
ncbi:hypothetical protein CRV08_16015 [Halarcobacter ebronensis]|uniref:YrdC-like domain-containing protein n=1 Tax=Halarcobacter ebronensis TaxID=1462615 RepID=A0A4Q0XZ62_9BACT|nr:hypothetical protein CRV08_16015 [Halarcobacter ebronensis]